MVSRLFIFTGERTPSVTHNIESSAAATREEVFMLGSYPAIYQKEWLLGIGCKGIHSTLQLVCTREVVYLLSLESWEKCTVSKATIQQIADFFVYL